MNPFDPPPEDTPSKPKQPQETPPPAAQGSTAPKLKLDSLSDTNDQPTNATKPCDWKIDSLHQQLLEKQRGTLCDLLGKQPKDSSEVRQILQDHIWFQHHKIPWSSLCLMIRRLYKAASPYKGGAITLGGWGKPAPVDATSLIELEASLRYDLSLLKAYSEMKLHLDKYDHQVLLGIGRDLKKDILYIAEQQRDLFMPDERLLAYLDDGVILPLKIEKLKTIVFSKLPQIQSSISLKLLNPQNTGLIFLPSKSDRIKPFRELFEFCNAYRYHPDAAKFGPYFLFIHRPLTP